MRLLPARALLLALVLACGDAPLQAIGARSSEWISEPTVVTTTTVPTTIPLIVATADLTWFNDDIVGITSDEPSEVLTQVFSRRQGDRFVQASRMEIAAALPEVRFPMTAPFGTRYVTSQLVFDNTGALAEEPTVAFGLWTSEPYTRSRSVAQIVVLRVSTDPDSATEIADPDAEISCALFSDRATENCALTEAPAGPVWRLTSTAGTTLVWFDGIFRYELFGRTVVPVDALIRMQEETRPIGEITTESG